MPESRAVERSIEPGNSAVCPVCGETVKFKARTQGRQIIANIYVNTNLAAAGGVLAAMIATQLLYKKIDLTFVLNGAIAGLVSITAEPLMPSPGAAVLIGAVGGVIVVLAVPVLDRLRIDDVVGAIPAHLCAGIWGTLAVPLSNPDTIASPLREPEYEIAAEERSRELELAADESFDEGKDATENADRYIFTTVFLAGVLFFAGVSMRFTWIPVRIAVLVLDGVVGNGPNRSSSRSTSTASLSTTDGGSSPVPHIIGASPPETLLHRVIAIAVQSWLRSGKPTGDQERAPFAVMTETPNTLPATYLPISESTSMAEDTCERNAFHTSAFALPSRLMSLAR